MISGNPGDGSRDQPDALDQVAPVKSKGQAGQDLAIPADLRHAEPGSDLDAIDRDLGTAHQFQQRVRKVGSELDASHPR